MAEVNKKTLRAAVIGCGRIGALTEHREGDGLPESYFPTNHCAAIRATEDVELIAVCDTNLESAKKAAELHDVPNIYTDFKKMILEQKPDIVSIATRMKGRREIISFAANSGVRALHIEKPLADNLEDTRKILASIDEKNIAVSYGAIRRYMPVYRQAKELLQSGRFGKLREIILDFGRSALLWTHPHSVDLINFFTDNSPTDSVRCRYQVDKKDITSDTVDADPVIESAIVKLGNGVTAKITTEDGQHTKLICESGEILILSSGKELKTVNTKNIIENISIEEGPSARCQAIIELRDAIKNGEPTSINTNMIYREQELLMMLGLSGAINRKVGPSEIPERFTVTGRNDNLFP